MRIVGANCKSVLRAALRARNRLEAIMSCRGLRRGAESVERWTIVRALRAADGRACCRLADRVRLGDHFGGT